MRRPLLVSIALGLLACEDESAGLGGVEASRNVRSLDPAEWADACGAAADLARERDGDTDAQRGLCLVSVVSTLTSSDPVAACETEVDQCLAAGPAIWGRERGCAPEAPASCDASVAEIERCLRVNREALASIGRTLECAEATPARVDEALRPIDEACDAISERCPDFFVEEPEPRDGGADAGAPIDVEAWTEAIRERVEASSVSGCGSAPAPSAHLDRLAAQIAPAVADSRTPALDVAFSLVWHGFRNSDLPQLLDRIAAELGEEVADAGCLGESYGLFVLDDGDGFAQVVLITAACTECDGVCSSDC